MDFAESKDFLVHTASLKDVRVFSREVLVRKSERRGKPQLADVVFVSVFLTVRLGRSDAEVE